MTAIRSSEDIRSRYDYTYNLSRRGWAWEFLRRNPDFQQDAIQHAPSVIHRPCQRNIIVVLPGGDQSGAHKWGLHYFPDPNLDGLLVDAFWRTELYTRCIPLVLSDGGPGHVDEIFERTTLSCKAVYVMALPDGAQFMIVVGQARTIQAACTGISFMRFQNLRMSIGINDTVALKQKLRIIDRAGKVYEHTDRDQFPEWSARGKRFRDALIALDCAEAGMSLKETATILHGEVAVQAAWTGTSRSMKDGVRRLKARGKALRGGQYKALLAGPS